MERSDKDAAPRQGGANANDQQSISDTANSSKASALKQSVTDRLLDLFREKYLALEIRLWRSQHEKKGYVSIKVGEHFENHTVESKAFRNWLTTQYWGVFNKVPHKTALDDAIENIGGEAAFSVAPEYEVHIRIAEHNGAIYLDLGDDEWRAVKITEAGWEIVSDPPVKFRRPNGMLPLPEPQRGSQ